ncbi:MAG: hypothetical protein AB7U75_13790 [Hyphomicrobiaceae bacterium]
MPNIFTLHRSAYYYASNPEIMKFIGEKHPKARFIEEIALKNKSGGYTPNPGLVFYEKKPQDGHPHYFAYYKYPDFAAAVSGLPPKHSWVIVGLPDFDPVIDAFLVRTEEGGVLTISRFGHDFVGSPVGGVSIDGGRQIERLVGNINAGVIVQLNLNTMTFELDGETHYVSA